MVITLLFGFAAVNTGNNLLFLVVSVLLGFMAVTGMFGWANIQGLQVECRVPDEVYCGAPTLLTVRLKNGKRFFPAFLLRLDLMGSSATFPYLGRNGEESATFTRRFPERGAHAVGLCTVFSPFPVNFFVRGVKAELSEVAIVFPSPRKAAATAVESSANRAGVLATPRKGHDGEVMKISEYSGGEPMKMIHWRLSAKYEDLKVKELAASAVTPVIIDPALLPGEDMEVRLSAAAYLVNRLIRGHRPVGLRLNGETIPAALSRSHRLRLLKELALYGQHQDGH